MIELLTIVDETSTADLYRPPPFPFLFLCCWCNRLRYIKLVGDKFNAEEDDDECVDSPLRCIDCIDNNDVIDDDIGDDVDDRLYWFDEIFRIDVDVETDVDNENAAAVLPIDAVLINIKSAIDKLLRDDEVLIDMFLSLM